MKCNECRDLLWIYLEWQTTPEESAEIKAHLAECPECRKAASQHMAVLETLHTLPEAELPEGFHAELMQKLAAEPLSAEETAEAAAVLPAGSSTPPVEWKVVRKTEILQKAKAEKELEKKRQHQWKRLSLAAAAALIVVAAGGIGGILQMRQAPPEPMQLTAGLPDEGGTENALLDSAAEHTEFTAAGGTESRSQKQAEIFGDTAPQENILTEQPETAQPETENSPAPIMFRSAPAAGSAQAAPEAAQAVPEAAALEENPPTAADEAETADFSSPENGTSPQPMAQTKSGDLLRLHPENGADAYGSVRRAAELCAGFEESADGSKISVMIPVENTGAFFAELGALGEIEWQTQGAEEVGAMYRRIEIFVDAE